jgi:ATP-dependent RNA circularization protein (DNA/RNA ligase family)
MKASEFRKLIREEVRKILNESEMNVVDSTTVEDLIAFLSKIDGKMKITAIATIESGRSTSISDPANFCTLSVEDGKLNIVIEGEETDYA